jgi:hypothetical protein
LPTLDTFLKKTKEARVFRRAQAVRDVVCVFRSKVATDSDRTLPPIPAEGCH